MGHDQRRLYKALAARDARFDGVFFVGVTSTGIYCRPICPVKTPKEANCRFFDTAQETEQAGFRPCLRCRPELAPGSAPVDDAQRIAQLIVQRLEEGAIDGNAGLEEIAGQFELSSRQIRRIVQKELGVPPIQLLLTRRLLLAKQLLTETALPVTEIAFASGFSSLRRFNDAFNARYKMAPTRLRKKATEGAAEIADSTTSTLQLSYRPPYDWNGVLAFLSARALAGIEWVTSDAYARTVTLGDTRGWIRVTHAPEEARVDARVHPHAHPGASGASLPGPCPVRSQRPAGHDREASGQGRAPRPRRQGQPRPARARGLQRVRDGPAGDPRAAGDRESRHHHRLPLRRGVRRSDRDAVSRAASVDAVGGTRGAGRHRRHRQARHRGCASPQHRRAGEGAGIGRARPRGAAITIPTSPSSG